MKDLIVSSCALLALFSVGLGVVYPLGVTAVAQVLDRDAANGSPVHRGDAVVGSSWLGQSFDDPRYFWGRPSQTSVAPYDAAASSGSNLGPSNPALHTLYRTRIAAMRAANPDAAGPVPLDLVAASGSGLDPHISPAAALYQVQRVARARGLTVASVAALVQSHTEGRTLGVLGEPRVAVLPLNLALDQLGSGHAP